MLRITVNKEATATRFVVEGKLSGDAVAEFEKCWRSTVAKTGTEELQVDLSSVTFIDSNGKQLLSMMREHGTRLTACGLFPKACIDEIEHADIH